MSGPWHRAGPDGARHVAHLVDAHERRLDAVYELALDELGRGARPEHAHRQHGKVVVGHLAYAEASHADGPEDDQEGHEHPGEDGPAYGQIGEGHKGLL